MLTRMQRTDLFDSVILRLATLRLQKYFDRKLLCQLTWLFEAMSFSGNRLVLLLT